MFLQIYKSLESSQKQGQEQTSSFEINKYATHKHYNKSVNVTNFQDVWMTK